MFSIGCRADNAPSPTENLVLFGFICFASTFLYFQFLKGFLSNCEL